MAYDHQKKAVVVAVRGTLSVADAFTDLTIGMKKVHIENEPLLDNLDTRVHKVSHLSWLQWNMFCLYVCAYVRALATVLYLQLPPSFFLVAFTLHSSPLSLISFSLVISPPSPQFYFLSLPFSLTSVFLHSPSSFLCSLFLLTAH